MKKQFISLLSLLIFPALVLAQPKRDTGPGSDNTLVYVILGVVVVAAVIYVLSTRRKK